MRRLLTGLAGALGVAALLRALRRRETAAPAAEPDPAAELRAKLAQARDTPDDRDAFDAAEGVPVDEAVAPPETRSIEERRRAIHEKAEEALGHMRTDPDDLGTPRWVKVFGLVALFVVALIIVLMLVGGGQHGPGRVTGEGMGEA